MAGPSFSVQSPAGDVGAAWADTCSLFNAEQYAGRGGIYEWGQGAEEEAAQRALWDAAE